MDWTEYIIPIIVFVFWLLGNMFGKSNDEDDAPRQKPNNHPAPEEDAQTRRLQEEIRRKIAERQGQSRPQEASRMESRSTPPPVRRSEPEPIAQARDYSQEIAHYREQAQHARQKLDATRDKAKQKSEKRKLASPAHSGDVRTSVLSMLSDAQGARKGFLLQEILGTPVGLRKNGAMTPPWET